MAGTNNVRHFTLNLHIYGTNNIQSFTRKLNVTLIKFGISPFKLHYNTNKVRVLTSHNKIAN